MLALAVLLLLLLAAAWWWLRPGPGPGPLARPVPPPQPGLPLAALPAAAPSQPAVAPRAASRVAAAPQARPDPVPQPSGCGAADAPAPLERWLGAMQASADERQRAAGWLIAMPSDGETMRDRLATLAATSTDPAVQAYAQRACRSDSQVSSACLALPADAWVRTEPDNAAAWLALAADGRADAAAQAEARRRAAQASRFDAHMARLPLLAAAAQPAGLQPGDWLAMAAALGRSRGDWLVTEALRTHCVAVLPQESGPRDDCTAIAELLLQQAQTLPDLQQARELGARLGWPASRLQELRDQEAQLAGVWRRLTEVDDPRDCASLSAAATVLRAVDQAGEVPAMRRALDSGVRP